MKVKWLLKKVGTAIYDNRANIEFVVGAGLVVAGTAMAMSKAEEAVDVKREMERQIKEIELTDEDDGWETSMERTKACLTMAKTTAVGYAKTYALPIGVEVGGLVLMGVSHATLQKQVGTLSASLASTALAFANYRERVREELGDQKDEDFLLGKNNKIVNVDVENGEEKVTVEPLDIPDHAFFFDEVNAPDAWEKEGFMNYDYLTNHERWLNDRLWREGVLWENDIRRDIKVPIDPKAAEWGITAVDDNGNRNYISFGINKNTERAQAFRDGTEKSFLIILDNMEPKISKKLYRLNKYHKDAEVVR